MTPGSPGCPLTPTSPFGPEGPAAPTSPGTKQTSQRLRRDECVGGAERRRRLKVIITPCFSDSGGELTHRPESLRETINQPLFISRQTAVDGSSTPRSAAHSSAPAPPGGLTGRRPVFEVGWSSEADKVEERRGREKCLTFEAWTSRRPVFTWRTWKERRESPGWWRHAGQAGNTAMEKSCGFILVLSKSTV